MSLAQLAADAGFNHASFPSVWGYCTLETLPFGTVNFSHIYEDQFTGWRRDRFLAFRFSFATAAAII
jgi:hypothetical protein